MHKNMKIKAEERRKRVYTQNSRSKEKNFKYISKFENNTPTYKKEKANDLFIERKNMFLKNLHNSKDKTHQKQDKSRSPSQSFSHNLTTHKKSQKVNQSSKELSPRVKQISERLYSRSKEKLTPCYHYQRHSESIERDRFFSIVHQNSFVQKYVNVSEQQALFQKFRR